MGESADKNRIPGLDAALTRVSDGYAANGKVTSGCLWESGDLRCRGLRRPWLPG